MNQRGWPRQEVVDVLRREFQFGERPAYCWSFGMPFMVNSRGMHPFIITSDPQVDYVARLAGEPVAFLPALLGPAQPCEASGAWWLDDAAPLEVAA